MFYENAPHSRHWRRKKGFTFLFALAGLLLLFGLVVMGLWNAILPPVTGVQPLTYWQAVGLLVLSRLLFGGWRPRRPRYGGPPSHWREKWAAMSEEERARYRKAWRNRCRSKKGGEPPEQEDTV